MTRRNRYRRANTPLRWLGGIVVLGILAIPIGDGVNAAVKSYPNCRVISVVDGDTVKLYCENSGLTSGRLLGFDTPEMDGQCISEYWAALRATFYLRWKLWTARVIDAHPDGHDRYDRVLTSLRLDGEGIAKLMVQAGHARSYSGGKRQGWCV